MQEAKYSALSIKSSK